MERGKSGQCRQERLLGQDRVAGKRGSWRGQGPMRGTQAQGALAQTSTEEADGQQVRGGERWGTGCAHFVCLLPRLPWRVCT